MPRKSVVLPRPPADPIRRPAAQPRNPVRPDNVIPFEPPPPRPGIFSIAMKSELVEKASEIIPDPLVLINVVSKRVRHLNGGRSPLIPTRPGMGAADIALTEIIEGKIRLMAQPAAAAAAAAPATAGKKGRKGK